MWTLAIKAALDWLWGKASELVLWAIQKVKNYKEDKKTSDANEAQAKIVEAVAEEIKNLIKQGLPVPEELREKLREESRKLIDGTFKKRDE